MKANEILKAIGVQKNKYTVSHCSKLSNVFTFLEDIKKDIVIAEITDKDFILYVGKDSGMEMKRNEWQEVIYNLGEPMTANKITLLTEYGEYSFALPVDNEFYFAVCDLLGLNYEAAKVEIIEPIYKIVTDPVIMDNIKKAAKFTGKDALRPVFECICLDFSNEGLQVVATDAHKIYYSKPVCGEIKNSDTGYMEISKCKPMQLLISPDSIKELCKSKIDYDNALLINIYSETKANINGIDVVLCNDLRYPDYKCVIPGYTTKMTFDRKHFCDLVKTVQQSANKSTNQVDFHLNGNIEMTAQDRDFKYESIAQMNYNFKEFKDTDIAFNGTFIREALSIFKAKEIDMYSEGHARRPAIFTDGTDKVLLMPLMINS